MLCISAMSSLDTVLITKRWSQLDRKRLPKRPWESLLSGALLVKEFCHRKHVRIQNRRFFHLHIALVVSSSHKWLTWQSWSSMQNLSLRFLNTMGQYSLNLKRLGRFSLTEERHNVTHSQYNKQQLTRSLLEMSKKNWQMLKFACKMFACLLLGFISLMG